MAILNERWGEESRLNLPQRQITLPKEILASRSPENLLAGLTPCLDQAKGFSQGMLRLPPIDSDFPLFPELIQKIQRSGISCLHTIHLNEFFLSPGPVELLAQGVHLAVVIDQNPPAAALEQMKATLPYLNQIKYIVVGKKDWRFKDTFRSLPAFIRTRLFFDFPVSLMPSDSFYLPAELAALLEELKHEFGLEEIRPYAPHFHLQTELLSVKINAVSVPVRLTEEIPSISIVTSDPEIALSLERSEIIQKLANQIEIIVCRVAGQKTKVVRSVKGVSVLRLWVHLDEPEGTYPEIQAHLQNWGALHAKGEIILFADHQREGDLDELLRRIVWNELGEEELLRMGAGVIVNSEKFKASGGFDPLYFSLGIGDLEFLYRYLNGFDPLLKENRGLIERLRGETRNAHHALGLRLFFHQYFDFPFFSFFSEDASLKTTSAVKKVKRAYIRNQLRYRLEQSRDAYLNLYKASPTVAFHGNIQILLRPFHYLRRHLWRFKKVFYALQFISGKVWGVAVQPFHFARRHLWRFKAIFYALKLISGKIWGIAVQPFHFARRHLWKLKIPFYALLGKAWGVAVQPFHFARRHLWKLKIPFYALQRNAWRVKQIYHLIFWLVFPFRKIFYFCEFQYEKRILGLHNHSKEALVRK